MPQKPDQPRSGDNAKAVDEPSYRAGVADGRVQAIEESMDAVAALIVKAEAMAAALGAEVSEAMRDNAQHTVRALYLAFGAVCGARQGSAAFQSLLAETKARLAPAGTMH